MTVTTPLGQVLRDEEGMRLEFIRTYDDPVDEVWSALTEPDRVARWIGALSGDPAAGTVELVMSEEDGATPQIVTILECAADAARGGRAKPRRHLAPRGRAPSPRRIHRADLHPTSCRAL